MKKVLIFLAGAIVGGGAGFVAHKYLDKRDNEKEISELREYYDETIIKMQKELDEYHEAAKKAVEEISKKAKAEKKKETDKNKAEEIVEENNYISAPKKKSSKKKEPDIFVIEPNDFRELNGFEKVTLTYFEEEDIFIDEDGNVVDGAVDFVGSENLNSFGQFEEKVLYVRNKKLSCDYEILQELRDYESYIADEFGE